VLNQHNTNESEARSSNAQTVDLCTKLRAKSTILQNLLVAEVTQIFDYVQIKNQKDEGKS
jgi:hypothetical protein